MYLSTSSSVDKEGGEGKRYYVMGESEYTVLINIFTGKRTVLLSCLLSASCPSLGATFPLQMPLPLPPRGELPSST